jgi:uncharacterized membrane protein YhaH (DUF805 family)
MGEVMGFSEAVRVCLGKYITFSGRAKRPEFWYFMLFVFLGGIIFSIIDYVLFGGTTETTSTSVEVKSNGPLASIFNLAILLPYLAAGWRRMHDTGRSGLYLFFPMIVTVCVGAYLAIWGGMAQLMEGNVGAFIDGLGGLVAIAALVVLILSPLIVLFWLLQRSQPGDNKYGPAA